MLSTPDIIDSHPDLKTLIDFQHFGGEKAFHGRVKTVRCFEDNSFVKKVLSNPSDSEVLIVDGGRSKHCALLGDLLAQMAKNNGHIKPVHISIAQRGNKGKIHAIDKGIQQAKGDIIITTDADIWMGPNWMEKMWKKQIEFLHIHLIST